MSIKKKKYVAPRYEMVRFDSQIMTAWSPGCYGVTGVLLDENGDPMASTCYTTTGNYSNVWVLAPKYTD